jgi:Dehydrogenases with different specificities (related to short-chain alcohol dehydrogenases)
MGMKELFSLSGKNAVVTGGAQGLGWGIARVLAQAGARVLILDRKKVTREQLAELASHGPKAMAVQADLSDRDATRGAIREVLSVFEDRVDILVNNAGIQFRAPFDTYPEAAWDNLLQVNLSAPFLLAQAFSRGMIARASGKIINLASIRSFIGSVDAVAYGASKGGILQLTRSLSNDLAPHGIQVNAIAPGFMETDMTDDIRNNPVARQALLARVPAGRLGQAEDVGALALFLASPAANYITGAAVRCDGGFLAA